jgi:hypothetical protein
MIQTTEAVDRAREETRTLYKQIEQNTAANHAVLRSDLDDAAEQANRLAASLKKLAADRRTDQQKHLEHASLLLEQAAAGVQSVSAANAADLRKANAAMQQRTRDALQDISHAIAAKRSESRTAHG